jgi:hypothetical protein
LRICALRQALQTNLEEAMVGKDMVGNKAGTKGRMALCSTTFPMTSVFCCTDCPRPLLVADGLPRDGR